MTKSTLRVLVCRLVLATMLATVITAVTALIGICGPQEKTIYARHVGLLHTENSVREVFHTRALASETVVVLPPEMRRMGRHDLRPEDMTGVSWRAAARAPDLELPRWVLPTERWTLARGFGFPSTFIHWQDDASLASAQQSGHRYPDGFYFRGFVVNVLFWGFLLLSSLLAVWLAMRLIVRVRGRRLGICVKCGYRVDELIRCPECGAANPLLVGSGMPPKVWTSDCETPDEPWKGSGDSRR
jgi:hypothetical protein